MSRCSYNYRELFEVSVEVSKGRSLTTEEQVIQTAGSAIRQQNSLELSEL